MKFLTLAAGFAVGYVLGTKAGREKYEQIAVTARKLGSHPTVVQAQEKAKGYLETGGEAVTAKLKAAPEDAPPEAPTVSAMPGQRRAAAGVTPDVAGDPLV
jgi:hypothetical protein